MAHRIIRDPPYCFELLHEFFHLLLCPESINAKSVESAVAAHHLSAAPGANFNRAAKDMRLPRAYRANRAVVFIQNGRLIFIILVKIADCFKERIVAGLKQKLAGR